MEELIELLKRKKKEIDELIFTHLPQSHQIPELNLLYRMVNDYPGRTGKGLRGTLCLLACEAFSGDTKAALPVAAALELFQSWILIRDDMEDNSEERRGGPALHKKHGIPLAMNASDALYTRIWELLLSNRGMLGDESTCRILDEFIQMSIKTTEGQHIELSWVEENRWDLEENDYYAMCGNKTSWYTFIVPLRLGGIVGGAEQSIMDGFIPFGLSLGIAFQIQDDILNLVGEEKKYGKEIGGDIWEGKRTLIAIHFLKSAQGRERKEALRVFSKSREQITSEEVERVLHLMDSSSSIEYARTQARKISREAKDVFETTLKEIPEGEAKAAIRAVVDFVVEREL